MQKLHMIKRTIFQGVPLLIVLLLAGCVLSTAPSNTDLPGSTVPMPTPDAGQGTATPATVENTSWQLASFAALGTEIPVITDSLITLEFSANGEAAGSSGCNSYGGAYQVQEDTILFSEVASTLMACVDEDVMQQEFDYLAALQAADRFVIAGDALTIWYDDESSMLNFVAAAPTAPLNETPIITPGATLTATETLTSTASIQIGVFPF